MEEATPALSVREILDPTKPLQPDHRRRTHAMARTTVLHATQNNHVI